MIYNRVTFCIDNWPWEVNTKTTSYCDVDENDPITKLNVGDTIIAEGLFPKPRECVIVKQRTDDYNISGLVLTYAIKLI